MRCVECGAEFDEMNESQPVCPGCGSPLGTSCDDADIGALMDEAAVNVGVQAEPEADNPGFDSDQPLDVNRMPVDLQEALDDAEALLLATGHATFELPEGFRMFPFPTERVM